MTGRVRCFLPTARRGILEMETGEQLPFSVGDAVVNLQGGDIVEFDLVQDGRPLALNVTLRHRWAEMLNEQYRPLVNQFHNTIRMRA